MRRNRRLAAALVGTAALALATTPAVVVADSVTGELIRGLNQRLLYIAVPIAILVEVILFYAVWRFRDDAEPEPTRENRELEITWTVATALVLLFVGTASYAVLAHPYVASDAGSSHGHGHDHGGAVQPGSAPPEAVEVVVVAEQWDYTFRYPDADVTTREELVLPTDRPLHIYLTSDDVIHSFHVPGLGLKQDMFPGQFQRIRTRIVDEGEHRLYCAEFCGTGHSTMVRPVRVVSPETFDGWLADRGNASARSNGTESNDSAAVGRP